MSKRSSTPRRRTLGANNPLDKLGDDPLGFIPSRPVTEEPVEKSEPPSSSPAVKQISVRVPVALYKRLKVSVARSGESQQDYLTRVIGDHLDAERR